jgi:hypothetical protein
LPPIGMFVLVEFEHRREPPTINVKFRYKAAAVLRLSCA